MREIIKLVCVLTVTAAIGACDTVPKAEFQAYSAAFNDVKTSSERMIAELALAEKAKKQKETKENPSDEATPYPNPSTLTSLAAGDAPDDNIAERRRALEVVARYNDVMLVLAEGKSAAEVRSSVDSLIAAINSMGTLLNAAVPVLPEAATSIVSTLLTELQKAQNRAQFIKTLKLGEPLIEAILNLLKDDAVIIYKIRWAMTEKQVDNRIFTILIMVEQMKSVVGEFKAPAGDADTEGSSKAHFNELDKELGDTLDSVGLSKPKTWPHNSGGAAFTEVALSQLQQTKTQIQAEATKILALQSEQRALAEVTISYINLVNQTISSLSVVRLALDKPVDIKAQAVKLVKFAFKLRKDIVALEASRGSGT